MRLEVVIALASLAVAGAQQRGSVSSVTADLAPAGMPSVFTLTGSNPCSTVRVDFGDGANETHNIRALPANIRHTYSRQGTFQVRARGLNDCIGLAAMTVRLPARAADQPVGGADTMRFRGMDRNGDGRVTRAEWNGSAQSFRVHDWNGDDVLSGDEVRPGANRRMTGDPDYTADRYWLDDWSQQRFTRLDADNNNRVTRQEWPFDYEAFMRADRNRDGALSQAEFVGVAEFDDDRVDQFDYLDLNGNNRIEQSEWHASAEAFEWLDRNGDGTLTRPEMTDESVTRDQFTGLDFNNDRSISPNEWQWSRASFDRLDRNRDGRLSLAEFDAAGPIGETGTSGPIAVPSTNRWTDTGIYVRAGDILTFNASGTIQMTGERGDPADPTGSRTGRRAPDAPLPNEPAGALIARIGTGTPVAVGRDNQIRASVSGRLYLGVNDDHLADNSGEFSVTIGVKR